MSRKKVYVHKCVYKLLPTYGFKLHGLIVSEERKKGPKNRSFRKESEDALWNYFREDDLLHSFHARWHELYDNAEKVTRGRPFELFGYMHQQLVRR